MGHITAVNAGTGLLGGGGDGNVTLSLDGTTATLANPTGTVGLTAVNGTAATVPRSDSAPPLSQAIVPTWTGVHTFSAQDVHSAGIDVSASNIVTDASTGTKLGTAVTQKLALWNAAPIVQPKSANQAALTNSTGGSYDATLVDVTTATLADPAKINSNFTDVFTLLDAIRTALVTAGVMKGAA